MPVAQLRERTVRICKAEGSNPFESTKKDSLCGILRKEGATVIFAKGELYCYAVIFGLRPSYIRFASFWGEYNITETASFNITLRDNAKYHCETCLTISLNILIFEIG